MATKSKYSKGGGGRFVQLPEWLQQTGAWATMPPGPRALYIELKRRYNGANNGEIFFSHRDAAIALAAHRNTVGGWFKELQRRGFIEMTRAPHLGPSGVGRSSTWALAEFPMANGQRATMAFKSYQEQPIGDTPHPPT